jgi:hypothetical protein
LLQNARELVRKVRAFPANPVLQDARTRCPCLRVFRPAAKVRERGCESVRLSGMPFDRVPKKRTAPPSHVHIPLRQSGSLMVHSWKSRVLCARNSWALESLNLLALPVDSVPPGGASGTLALRHDQKAAKFVDLTGEAQRLRLQHAHGVAAVALLDQFGDTLVEGGQFVEQPVKLALDR